MRKPSRIGAEKNQRSAQHLRQNCLRSSLFGVGGIH
jgi:hypothetical protein